MPVYKIQKRYQDSGWIDVLTNDHPRPQLFTSGIAALRQAEEWSRDAIAYGMCRVVNVRRNHVLFEFAAGHEPLAVLYANGHVSVHPVAEGLDPREVELEMSRDIHSEMAARAFPDDPTPDIAVTAAAEDEFRRAYGPRGDPVVTEEDMRRFMDRSPSDPLPVRENQSGDFRVPSHEEIETIRHDVPYGRAIRAFVEGAGGLTYGQIYHIVRNYLSQHSIPPAVEQLDGFLAAAVRQEHDEARWREAMENALPNAPPLPAEAAGPITREDIQAAADTLLEDTRARIERQLLEGMGIPPHLFVHDSTGSGSAGGEVPAATAEDWASSRQDGDQRRPRGVNLSRRRGVNEESEDSS